METAALLADLLAKGPYERSQAPFRLVRLEGPEAGEFLHRLCTQDVLGLLDGGLRPAGFLDAKGKLVATCLIARVGDVFWLETQAEQADRLSALLERYHFTEKLTITGLPPAACRESVQLAAVGHNDARLQPGGAIAVRVWRRGVQFERSHGGEATPATRVLSAALAECVRQLAGFVRVGVETEPTTLALEADLDDHISTAKGCYTGQEIVARINTYGHTNRRLCLLWLGPGEPITAPQPLHELEDQLAVGRVMHALPVPGYAARLGLGFLPKDFHAIGGKLALADGGTCQVIG